MTIPNQTDPGCRPPSTDSAPKLYPVRRQALLHRLRNRPERFLRLGVLLLPLVGMACGQDAALAPAPSSAGFGRIHGRLTGGTGPLGLSVQATSASNRSTSSAVAATADSSGDYAMVVPFGRYTLAMGSGSFSGWPIHYTRAGVSLDECDTLIVSAENPDVSADMVTGALRLRVHWPASLQRQPQTFELSMSGSRSDYRAWRQIEPPNSPMSDLVFDGLPPGTAILDIRGADPVDHYSSGFLVDQGLRSIQVTTGETMDFEFSIPEPCSVNGRWRGSWVRLGGIYSDAPYESSYHDPILEGRTDDSVAVLRTTLAKLPGSEGTFSLRVYGSCRVRFRVSLLGTSWWLGGPDFEHAPSFELRPGESLSLPDIVESGILCHLDPGVPIPGFSFKASLMNPEGGLLNTYEASCGECGGPPTNIFIFCGLEPGRYLLRFDRRDAHCSCRWVARWYPGVALMADASAVEIHDPGEVLELSWALTNGGVIAGRIEATDTPLPRWYEIGLFAAGDTSTAICGSYPYNMPAGSFRFKGLDDGEYFVKLTSHDSTPVAEWFPGVAGAAQAETLRVSNLTGPEDLVWPWP